MKYIIILDVEKRQEYPFIFAANLIHSEVARDCIYRLRNTVKSKEFEVIAAGFCNIGEISCKGDSETLNIKSRKAFDSDCIIDYNSTHGIQL